MRPTAGAGALALLILAAIGFAAAPSASRSEPSSAAAPCSKALAKQLVNQHNQNHFALPNPVVQALCGPFTGPGSQAMAVTILAPTCWPVQHWVVFTLSGGSWRLVHEQPAYLHPPLVRVGNGIRETTAVQRPGDPRCFPSGGKRSRIWHWNGSRLVAGPWKQLAPTKPRGPLHLYQFRSPSQNLSCSLGDSGTAHCFSRNPPHSVTMGYDGTLDICRGSRCVGSSRSPGVPTLGYGQTNEYAGYRCLSLEIGVRCTVIKTGKGFLINRDGVTRVG